MVVFPMEHFSRQRFSSRLIHYLNNIKIKHPDVVLVLPSQELIGSSIMFAKKKEMRKFEKAKKYIYPE